MKILYKEVDGEILCLVSDNVNIGTRYVDFDLSNVGVINYQGNELTSENLIEYKVIDENIIIRGLLEINELKKYGRVLTEEERLNSILMPSREEIQRAQTTIEILSLLQEVNNI